MIRLIQYLIIKFFGCHTIEGKASLAHKIFVALCTGDYDVLNKYCKSQACIDIMALRIYECQFNRYNFYQYRYDKQEFDSFEMLKNLCNNKKNMHISEFVALYFYLKSSLFITTSQLFDTRFNAFKGKEFYIYDKFLDKV
ncbi:hypothetical protein vBEcoMphAPEC6_02555 [Escherichia phage ph0011]|nr:hypothetical protein vBEcoMphAPEC6_02555 [Escherichia phage ph0011]